MILIQVDIRRLGRELAAIAKYQRHGKVEDPCIVTYRSHGNPICRGIITAIF